MASSRIVNNYKFNKLEAIRLDTVNPDGIRANTIGSITPNYLYSILANCNFTPTNDGGLLEIFNKDSNVIEFTDRPFRETYKISLADFVIIFNENFTLKNEYPNAVLINDGKQETFVVSYGYIDIEKDSVVYILNSTEFNEDRVFNSSFENSSCNFFVDSVINPNIAALQAQKNAEIINQEMEKSMARVALGERINSNDITGLNKLFSEVRGEDLERMKIYHPKLFLSQSINDMDINAERKIAVQQKKLGVELT
mgnify:CR=1 FL=1